MKLKTIFKKVTAAALAATMVVGMAACGSGSETASSSDSAASSSGTEAAATPAVTDNSKIKIGVSIWSSTDVLGSQCKLILDAAADALGVEVQYVDQGHVSEKVTASVEQLVAAGCQGIIICNSSDTEMTSAIKTCNDNGVYLAQFFRIISETNSADIYQAAKDSAYYIGAVHEDEPANGEALVNILLDKGDRDIGLIGWEQGDATRHIRMIRHSFLSRSTQVQLPKVVPRQQRLLWQQIRTWMHSSRQAAAVTLFRVQSQQ